MTTLAPSLNQGSTQSRNQQLAVWERNNKREADRILKVESALTTITWPRLEAANLATQMGRGRLEDSRAVKARYLYDCREGGIKPDPNKLADFDSDIARDMSGNEALFDAAAEASAMHNATKTSLNTMVKAANALAIEGTPVRAVEETFKGLHIEAIKQQRALLRAIDDEEARSRSAPETKDEFREAARLSANRLADSGAFTLAKDGSIRFAQDVLPVTPTIGNAVLSITDSAALVAFLMRDKLLEQVDAAVDRRYAGVKLTLTPMERRQRLAEIAERRLSAERVEVEAIFAAWADGIAIGLRKDTDPKALLGIA